VAGYGPGAANVVGLTDQTDLFFTASSGYNRNLAALSADATISAPAEVRPGDTFTVTAEGLDADWQTTAVLASDPVELGQADVLNGAVSYEVVAPTEIGAHTVTLTGAQTGKVLTANITVSAAAPASPSPSPSAVAITAPSQNSGPLAGTGGTVPLALAALALALIAGGTYLAIRRHRRHVAS